MIKKKAITKLINNLLNKNKFSIIAITLTLILSFVSVAKWFEGNSILYYVDSLVPLDINISFSRIFYGVYFQLYPGNMEANWSWFVYWLIFSAGVKVFGNLSLSQMFLYIFLLFFSVINFYLLSNHLWRLVQKNKKITELHQVLSFIFAIFYTFNLYTFFYGFFMFNPGAFIISFLPLNLLSVFMLLPLEGKRKNSSWIFIFIASLTLMSPGFITYIFIAQYLVWIILYLTLYIFIKRKENFKNKIFLVSSFATVMFISIWWWFFPSLVAFKDIYEVQSSSGTLSWFTGGFVPSQLLGSLRAIGTPLMYGNPFSWSGLYTEGRLFTLPLFLIPFLLIFFLYSLNRIKDKWIFIFLLLMLLVSLFIVKFSNPPFSFITRFAFENIPFFGAFRDSYHKAGIYFFLPLYLAITLGSGFFIGYLKSKKNKRSIYAFFLALCLLGVILTGPYFLFRNDNIRMLEFQQANKSYEIKSKTQIPEEYYELKEEFESDCKGKTVAVVPRGAWISSGHWEKYGNSYAGQDLMGQLLNCSFITTLAYSPIAEANNQVPYVLLQDNDYETFKNYLYKNQVSFLILRYDNLPTYFTNWIYVDPRKLSEKLDSDRDFEKKEINKYFTVYKLKKLDSFNLYGFSLNSRLTYVNSPLKKAGEFISLWSHMPTHIFPPVINTKEDLTKFEDMVANHMVLGSCKECIGKDEIQRLELGTNKKEITYELDVDREGSYECSADIFIEGAKIRELKVGRKNNLKSVNQEENLTLAKGRYFSTVSYDSPVVFSEKYLEISQGEIIEMAIGKLTVRNHRLTYEIKNKDLNIKVILMKKRLSKESLKNGSYEKDAILIEQMDSDLDKTIERIFQVDEFNISDYYLYLISEEKESKNKAIINNLIIEKGIDSDYVSVACLLTEGTSLDLSKNIKVKEISPVEYVLTLPKTFDKGFISFNKTYVSDWEAKGIINNREVLFDHFKNGHGNGWYVEGTDDRKIVIKLKRQDLILKNISISLVLIPLAVLMFIIVRRKNE